MSENVIFYFALVIFVATYFIIATEKIHKTVAALVGASLMMLFVLEGPGHGPENNQEVNTEIIAPLPEAEGIGGAAVAAPEAENTDPVAETTEIAESTMENASGTEVSTNVEENAVIATGEEPSVMSTEESAKLKRYDELDVFARYVDFNVIFTLAGMMLLVNILSTTGIFQYVAIKCAKISKAEPVRMLILLVMATAILSAFLDNVTTILLIAPVTLVVTAQLRISPIPFLMAETIASNIGGTATLIGDPPNLLIGSKAGLGFMPFLINLAPFVLTILIIYCIILYIYYAKRMSVTVEHRAAVMEMDENAAITDMANMKRGGIIMLLTIVGFLVHSKFGLQSCVVAFAGASLGLLFCKVDVDHALEKIEWSTLFFFMGLFVLVYGADQAGLMLKFGELLGFMHNWNPLLIILVIMWVSGICAGVMNNVSFTAAMIAVIGSFIDQTPSFAGNIEMTHLLWWGLALAVCLGGNATLVGAAANLVTAGIAEKAGHKMTFKHFLWYGLPVTFGSLVAASLYIVGRYFLIA
ncbi:MAG: ArsB/NhaD family transporter [Lentisphaeria bacterium]|nr:ArsB/NhaD family transporter [Lentisphaeria bacterium]